MSYSALVFADPDDYVNAPSPRYWLLWPGVLIMLAYSFADVTLSMIPIVRGPSPPSNLHSPSHSLTHLTVTDMRRSGALNFNVKSWFKNSSPDEDDEDETPLEDRIPTLWWVGGLIVSIIVCCAIMATMFHYNVGEVLLALLLGFFFSFIGVQSSGYTDINPVSTVAKASQLIFGGIGKGTAMPIKEAQIFNLTAGVSIPIPTTVPISILIRSRRSSVEAPPPRQST